ncbi:MAG: GTPase Era [Cytophagales bacterium]|nr:MAG: GTPase Era [Cytophagales bacterium]
MDNTTFKAGFVSIIGKPNVGKSTLMNQLVKEKISIITYKAQTTRHRIMGILNGDDFQIVYSDTPGIIKPKYELQKSMMTFVKASLEDADLVLWVVDITDKEEQQEVAHYLKYTQTPILVVLNKIDLLKINEVEEQMNQIASVFPKQNIVPISALNAVNVDTLLEKIKEFLPLHPPYFPQDELTDRSERFFASEIIREKIFLNYTEEIPYASEVKITEFKEKEDIIVIRAEILVERDSQKGIIIGKNGKALKKVGTEAREDLEAFFGKKVFLEQFVKVVAEWRRDRKYLERFGYIN